MSKKILCLGFGYAARALTRQLSGEWHVIGTTRKPDKAAEMAAEGIEPYHWDGRELSAQLVANVDAVLISTGPDDIGCPAARAAEKVFAATPPGWIGYLSSNGVYGNYNGAWVDEDSPLLASSRRGLNRIAAEEKWRSIAAAMNVPAAIFRLPGIYGPGRSAIDSIRAGKARRIIKPDQVFSRAHVDDIATTVLAALSRPSMNAVYNVADDEPAPPQDVIEYACELLGVAPPPEEPFDTADLSEMARSFYADNKRVKNDRIKNDLGVSLAYPTYREGLNAILAQHRD